MAHACIHAAALCISYNSVCNGSTRAPTRCEAHMHTNRPAYMFTLALVYLPIGLTLYSNLISCACASMRKEHIKTAWGGLFVDHPEYCNGAQLLLVHCARQDQGERIVRVYPQMQ